MKSPTSSAMAFARSSDASARFEIALLERDRAEVAVRRGLVASMPELAKDREHLFEAPARGGRVALDHVEARERAEHVPDVLPVTCGALDLERALELRARLVERALVEQEEREVDAVDRLFASIAHFQGDLERGAVAALGLFVAVLPVVDDAEVSEQAHHRHAIAERALEREGALEDDARLVDATLLDVDRRQERERARFARAIAELSIERERLVHGGERALGASALEVDARVAVEGARAERVVSGLRRNRERRGCVGVGARSVSSNELRARARYERANVQRGSRGLRVRDRRVEQLALHSDRPAHGDEHVDRERDRRRRGAIGRAKPPMGLEDVVRLGAERRDRGERSLASELRRARLRERRVERDVRSRGVRLFAVLAPRASPPRSRGSSRST